MKTLKLILLIFSLSTKIFSQSEEGLVKYQEAKNSFKYFSDESLKSIYEEFKSSQTESMERLALEEIMVEKGLISHSPMHEKLHSIKKKFDL